MAAISSPPVPSGSVVRLPPVPGGRVPQKYLAGLDDWELLRVVRSLEGGSGSRAAACELLVSRHRNLVCSCVRRYRGGTESAEDLMQVGYVGLMKAISRFDPAIGTNLAAYAQVCISGEIKRHFRDKCWPVHVNRSVQDLVLKARKATSQLTQDLGRAPTQSEMARHLGVSGDDLRDAQRAEIASRPSSLDAPLSGEPGTATVADVLGEEDRGVEHMLGMRAIAAHWGELPPREQKILLMRFDQDMTQAQIGQLLGISQMQVSRLSARALGYLRQRLLSQHKHASAANPAVPL
ncbi:MAG TPA: sigma-70 family RNA polymerase sigma factor [Streptosporangiaceae bacterium]|nr:sigma-70 family RNA polymerase sigma factor [Streptosporangiaceae bacterium]